jgi:hypothetical protein
LYEVHFVGYFECFEADEFLIFRYVDHPAVFLRIEQFIELFLFLIDLHLQFVDV